MRKGSGGDTSIRGRTESYYSILWGKSFEFVKRLLYLGAIFIIFTMIFKNVNFVL